jgi:hypothetical protein
LIYFFNIFKHFAIPPIPKGHGLPCANLVIGFIVVVIVLILFAAAQNYQRDFWDSFSINRANLPSLPEDDFSSLIEEKMKQAEETYEVDYEDENYAN